MKDIFKNVCLVIIILLLCLNLFFIIIINLKINKIDNNVYFMSKQLYDEITFAIDQNDLIFYSLQRIRFVNSNNTVSDTLINLER